MDRSPCSLQDRHDHDRHRQRGVQHEAELHAKPAQRVEELVRRGQSEGAFRTDLPASWLVSILYHVLKGAAADVSGGRLDPSDAPHFIVATVLAA